MTTQPQPSRRAFGVNLTMKKRKKKKRKDTRELIHDLFKTKNGLRLNTYNTGRDDI